MVSTSEAILNSGVAVSDVQDPKGLGCTKYTGVVSQLCTKGPLPVDDIGVVLEI